MGRIVLIRHGSSVWNEKGLWTGWHDIPLSAKGKEEARMAAYAIKDIEFHISFTSDLSRAFQTLEIIKKELNLANLPITKHSALKERHYGEFAGISKWRVKKKVGEEKFKKLRRGWNSPIKGGETLKDVFARVVPYFKESINPHLSKGKNVLVVAHGNSIRAIIKHLEGLSNVKIEEVEIRTGEVLLYEIDRFGKIKSFEKRLVNKDIGKQ